ncbi:MAG: DUF2793 domain-containing protein [Alphaproteobacteria bacterium]|nr:DUF2793 domain-containing protein [Alphaproteobacteria bacterium]MBV8548718.1 DUF2793 domain-containing protein [Alphaproteobacteria bacterium]
MTTTPNLALTYIATSQAQKEMTHNAALNDLDFVANISVIDHTLSTPPASPNTGDSYIVAASPTGVWTGYANAVAGYYGGWVFKTPLAGWTAWARNDSRLLYYNGTTWSLLATPAYDATFSWTPGTITTASGLTSSAVTLTNAALGDFVLVTAPYDLQGLSATAYVNAAGNVKVRLNNLTGASVTLAAGTWRVRVLKA